LTNWVRRLLFSGPISRLSNGIIKIPEKYKKKVKRYAKVILLTEETPEKSSDIIDELLVSPLQLSDFKPFKREEI